MHIHQAGKLGQITAFNLKKAPMIVARGEIS
jgi:hypothetical protein